jgi:hypothetical protein
MPMEYNPLRKFVVFNLLLGVIYLEWKSKGVIKDKLELIKKLELELAEKRIEKQNEEWINGDSTQED